jgi:hypothetical protein
MLDSSATGTFVTTEDAEHLHDTSKLEDGPTVLSASGTAMPATLKGQLLFSPELLPSAQSAFLLDDLKTGALILRAQLCDNNCIVVFANMMSTCSNTMKSSSKEPACLMDHGLFPSRKTPHVRQMVHSSCLRICDDKIVV